MAILQVPSTSILLVFGGQVQVNYEDVIHAWIGRGVSYPPPLTLLVI